MDAPTPTLREQGIQALREDDLDRAIDLLARVVLVDREDAEAQAFLGTAYSRKGLHLQARQALQQAIERQPLNARYRFELGTALERAGDPQRAAAAYRDALQFDSEHAEAQARLDATRAPASRSQAKPTASPERADSTTRPEVPRLAGEPDASSDPAFEYPATSTPGYFATPVMSAGEAFLRRLAAYCIDQFVVTVPLWLVMLLFIVVPLIVQVTQHRMIGLPPFPAIIWLLPLPSMGFGILMYAIYCAGMTAARGQTLGKMLLGLRVIGPDGGNPTYGRALLRETIGRWVSALLCLGYLWMLWDGEQQTWHDKIAGTHVERAGGPALAPSSQRRLRLALLGLLAAALALPVAVVMLPVGLVVWNSMPPNGDTKTCTPQLQAIGRALAAYQRDRGELPPHLSDLYPRYLTEKRVFHCPADPTSGSPGLQGVPPDPQLPISYLYEMSLERKPGGILLGPRPIGSGVTWRQFKLAQRVNFGDRVPVVRCWHHTGRRPPLVLNLTLTGEVYPSETYWEYAPAVVPAVLAALERDLAAGPQPFRRRWHPERIAEYFTTVPPIPALRGRYRAAAERLAAMNRTDAGQADSGTLSAVGSLYAAAGDTRRAITADEGAVRADPANAQYRERLARAYETAGQREQAARWRQKVSSPAPVVGQLAPDFVLADDAGKRVRLIDLRGKVVCLNFWASSSGLCRAEAPHLEALYRKYRVQGLVILGLDSEPDHPAATDFARDTVTYPVLLDAGPVSQRYGVRELPCAVLIGRDGRVTDRIAGYGPGTLPSLENEIRRLLAPEQATR